MSQKPSKKRGRKPKFKPEITRVKLNPEQAVLSCNCFQYGWVTDFFMGRSGATGYFQHPGTTTCTNHSGSTTKTFGWASWGGGNGEGLWTTNDSSGRMNVSQS